MLSKNLLALSLALALGVGLITVCEARPASSNGNLTPQATRNQNPNTPEGQYNIGASYHFATGAAQNLDKAIEWYTKAANQGHVKSQMALGTLYVLQKNPRKARLWLTKAARNGNPDAQYFLGQMFVLEIGGEADYGKAKRLFLDAVKQNCAGGYYGLGLLADMGAGEPVNKKKAMEYFRKGCELGSASSCTDKGENSCEQYQKLQDIVTRASTQAQPAPNNVRNNTRNSTGNNTRNNQRPQATPPAATNTTTDDNTVDPGILYLMGSARYDGIGAPKDINIAIELLTKSASQGHPGAQLLLGQIYLERRENTLAQKWLETAAKGGHPAAQMTLGRLYIDKTNNLYNFSKAKHWLQAAADQDCADGYIGLLAVLLIQNGTPSAKTQQDYLEKACYATNERCNNLQQKACEDYKTLYPTATPRAGTPQQDPDAPFRIDNRYELTPEQRKAFLRAVPDADFNDPQIQSMISGYFRMGFILPQNYEASRYWLTKAANHGHVISQSELAQIFFAKKDYAQAYRWASLAAQKNHVGARLLIGTMHATGQGVERNPSKVKQIFQTLVNEGHIEGYGGLGMLAELQGNKAQAMAHYKKACDEPKENIAALPICSRYEQLRAQP